LSYDPNLCGAADDNNIADQACRDGRMGDGPLGCGRSVLRKITWLFDKGTREIRGCVPQQRAGLRDCRSYQAPIMNPTASIETSYREFNYRFDIIHVVPKTDNYKKTGGHRQTRFQGLPPPLLAIHSTNFHASHHCSHLCNRRPVRFCDCSVFLL